MIRYRYSERLKKMKRYKIEKSWQMLKAQKPYMLYERKWFRWVRLYSFASIEEAVNYFPQLNDKKSIKLEMYF